MAVIISSNQNVNFVTGEHVNTEAVNQELLMESIGEIYTVSDQTCVPNMTSYTSPSGIVTYSYQNGATPAWQVFNRTTGGWQTLSGSYPHWVAYEFNTPMIISKISITIGYNESHIRLAPTSWEFQGTNDNGQTWDTLDEQNNITWTTISETKTFEFKNVRSYIKYRLFILQAPTNTCRIDFLQFMDLKAGTGYHTNGYHESDTIDMSRYFKGIKKVDVTSIAPDQTKLIVYSSTSENSIIFTNWEKLNNGTVVSPQFRYIRFKSELEGAKNTLLRKIISFSVDEVSQFSENTNLIFNGSLRIKEGTQFPTTQITKQIIDYKIDPSFKGVFIETNEKGRYSENLIPAMTSLTTPSGIVSAGSQNSASTPAWHAFNREKNIEGWVAIRTTTLTNKWIAYEFLTPKIITKYTMEMGSAGRSPYWPSSWIFEGTNDGLNWTIIQRETGHSWVPNEKKTFNLHNKNLYKTYRISNISSSSSGPMIDEIEMMYFSTIPNLRIAVSGDSGITWKSYSELSNNWIEIDVDDEDNFSQYGMTSQTINSLELNDWDWVFQNNTIRFAYYLHQNNSEEILEINNLFVNSIAAPNAPKVTSIVVHYDELDPKYSGLMFMDTAHQYYTTSIGEILKYLNFGTLIAGQTSLDFNVKLTNTYPFDVENIRISSETSSSKINVQLSKTSSPFVAECNLLFDQQLLFDEILDFYVRIQIDDDAVGETTFDIKVDADPI
ncbi:discoidin domain-containing protein [Paenibacillus paeoniae]|uniref:F5/8 type C domain-containing protein n=1 Tax=Paenibacillus paeoniae TaxID=2292705 RepID=A0A371PK35_9BACL|nr:discoidin domain-containing protein [Paenibacillus paeoniae]REK76295.1 hypothetical protein DX130_04415 [Paenibacillus paeoniae]